jgi:DNA replication initiation complex subunit (GINS family)
MAKLIARPPVRGRYVKLVRSEKKLVGELVDTYNSNGASLNDAIKEVNSKRTLFNTLHKSSSACKWQQGSMRC